MENIVEYDENVFSHPGETLKELIDGYHITSKELANKVGIDEHVVCDILYGKENISKDIANKLETIFQLPASFWIKLQEQYDSNIEKINHNK